MYVKVLLTTFMCISRSLSIYTSNTVSRWVPSRLKLCSLYSMSSSSGSSGNIGDTGFIDSLQSITSESNDKYKLFKLLYSKKKKRESENLVILESHRTIIDAIRYGMKPKSIFLTAGSLKAPLGSDLQHEINSSQSVKDVTCISTDSLVEKISDVESCQGVVGIFHTERVTKLPTNVSLVIACDRLITDV